ncbi:TPA: hypothetical protein ACLA3C_000905, partial [Neisseria meningitidis]
RQWDTNLNLNLNLNLNPNPNPNPNLHPDSDDSRFRKPPKKTNPAKAGGLFHIIDADRRFTNIATVPGTKSTNLMHRQDIA